MPKSDIPHIKAAINDINLIITSFLLDINRGLINDLSNLDGLVADLRSKISVLSKSMFEAIKEEFENMLIKVKELKEFLAEELESTSNRLKATNMARAASKRYKAPANDNS